MVRNRRLEAESWLILREGKIWNKWQKYVVYQEVCDLKVEGIYGLFEPFPVILRWVSKVFATYRWSLHPFFTCRQHIVMKFRIKVEWIYGGYGKCTVKIVILRWYSDWKSRNSFWKLINFTGRLSDEKNG